MLTVGFSADSYPVFQSRWLSFLVRVLLVLAEAELDFDIAT